MQKLNDWISFEKKLLSLCSITFNQSLNVNAETQVLKTILKDVAVQHSGNYGNGGCGFDETILLSSM